MKKILKNLFPVFLCCLRAFADEPIHVAVHYQWDSAHSYTYRSQVSDGTFDTVFDVLECTGGDYRICVRAPALAPEHALLISVDKYGSVKGRRIIGSPNVGAGDSDEKLTARLSVLIGLGDLFKAGIWELPPEGLTKNKASNYHGRSYMLKDYASISNADLLGVETIELPPTRRLATNRITRVFDVKKAVLNEYGHSAGSQIAVTKLVSVRSLDADLFAKILKECDGALDENAFLMQLCAPHLASSNKWVQRNAYFGLSRIHDPKLMGQVYSNLSVVVMTDRELSSDVYLFKHLERGEDWAIAVLQGENWSKFDTQKLRARIGKMEELTGLKFDYDQRKWKLWLGTVRNKLPRLRESLTQDLVEAARQSAEPWVRLFALKELCTRCDVDLKAVLEEAKDDKAKEVRDFVKEQLSTFAIHPHSLPLERGASEVVYGRTAVQDK